MDDATYRIRLLRIGIVVISAVIAVVFGVQIAQGQYGEYHAGIMFFVGACATLIGSVVFWVRDARAARAATLENATGEGTVDDMGDEGSGDERPE